MEPLPESVSRIDPAAWPDRSPDGTFCVPDSMVVDILDVLQYLNRNYDACHAIPEPVDPP